VRWRCMITRWYTVDSSTHGGLFFGWLVIGGRGVRGVPHLRRSISRGHVFPDLTGRPNLCRPSGAAAWMGLGFVEALRAGSFCRRRRRGGGVFVLVWAGRRSFVAEGAPLDDGQLRFVGRTGRLGEADRWMHGPWARGSVDDGRLAGAVEVACRTSGARFLTGTCSRTLRSGLTYAAPSGLV
jgi:hypothetical protein